MNDLNEFIRQAETANVIPVVETLSADLLTPLAVYLKLSSNSMNSFLLESVEGGETLARYSFIGVEPEMLISGDDSSVTIRVGRETSGQDTSVWNYLRQHFAGRHVAQDADLPSFIGGAIGYFGFSCSGWFEPSLKQSTTGDAPDAEFMFFRSIVAFDHAKQTIKVISLVFTDEPGGLSDLYDRAAATNTEIRKILETGPTIIPASGKADPASEVKSNWRRHDFEQAVVEIKDLIAAGECYQVVLSQCFRRATNATPVSIYRAVRSLNPSPYMFLLQFGEKAIIGASPEMLARARGRQLEYRPIAGTRPRGQTKEEDDRLADEMRVDIKEVAEHKMLVDLGRNDLGRVSEYGSVTVDRLMNVEKYSHVQHLVTYLSADLRDDLDRFDALAACFPAGTVSGAPKVRAIEIIQRLEPSPRGVYAGAVGYFDYAGNMDTCIAIRTLVLADGEASVQAGGGIVADSVPALEFEESVNKAKAMIRAIEIAEASGT